MLAAAAAHFHGVCGVDVKREELVANGGLCAEMSADCMSQFDMTNIGLACLEQLRPETIKHMNHRTAAQILATSSIADVPDKPELLAQLMRKNAWQSSRPDAFLIAAASSKRHADALMAGLADDPSTAARFFSAETGPSHSSACGHLGAPVLSLAAPGFFGKMSKACFRAIPPEAFEGLDSERLAAIPPLVLMEIGVKQAAKIPAAAFAGLTVAQAKMFGLPYVPLTPTDKDATEAQLATHPCSQARRALPYTKSDVAKQLRQHCRVSGDNAASRGPLQFSYALFSLSLCLAVVVAI